MSFKHINPGYSKVYGLNVSTVKNTQYNPINGVAINRGVKETIFDLPSDCNEIWIKFGTVFVDASRVSTQVFGIGSALSNVTGLIWRNLSSSVLSLAINGNEIAPFFTPTLWQYYNIVLHIRNGNNGLIRAFVDGKCVFVYNGAVSWANRSIYVANGYNYNANYISNIIISDTEISPTEEVYVLTPSNTEATMSESDGIYTATEAGQTLKQSIDVNSLTAKVGTSNIKISGIGVGSDSIYYDGEGLTRAASMRNDTEQEVIELSTDTSSAVVSTWQEDLSVAELANLKVGWKAKE